MKKCLCVLLAVLLACALSACSLLPAEETRRIYPVIDEGEKEQFEYAYVTFGDIESIKNYSCKYMPVKKVNLSFDAIGEYVDKMYVSQGDLVKEGQLLGRLRTNNMEGEIASCESEIARTELLIKQLEENRSLALRRQEILHRGDEEALASAQIAVNAEYDAARRDYEDNLDLCGKRLTVLNARMDDYSIYAPFDGAVTYARQVSDDHLTAPDELMFVISDSATSVFTLTTDTWENLPAGLTVTITSNKTEYEAVVTDEEELGLPAQTKEKGRSANVYLVLTTPAPELEDDDRGSFSVLLDARRDVLRISEDAVSRAGDDYIVYYETAEGIRSYKTVKLGLHAQGMYEVLEGLEEGEAVIVS